MKQQDHNGVICNSESIDMPFDTAKLHLEALREAGHREPTSTHFD